MASTRQTKPTLLVLVRHGRTETTGKVLPGRSPGLHLADAGRRQADAAAARLAGIDIAAVYSSPLERARETAAPIARAARTRVRRREGLNECDFGDWTGRRLGDLRRRQEWRTVQAYPSGFRFPQGESFAQMQARVTTQLRDLVAHHRGESIVAVSHADPIKAAVADALGVHLDHFQRIVISPCSLTPILYTTTGPVVLAVNSTGGDLSTLAVS
ncbi:MAG: Phosphoserine phosphatase 1 [Acidimicrobiales bacterium]|nr:MAG: MSMEG_4193 family putative phosphomutase [Actinomycetota bacterium]MBV6508845.1 Phosphoserine phosphatase 1 [Acidimicrobiales bacterium]RIK04972.1 MAG: phosphoglycerate mutase [Acidobacteriota bacterium]